jgi:phospholipase/carboxylesterase
MKIETTEIAGLTTRIVSTTAEPTCTVVLLHGFGAGGDDLVSLAEYIAVPARFVFPAAPIELGGLYGEARAWWRLDLAKLEHDLRTGAVRDRRAEIPEGLQEARAALTRFLDDVVARYSIDSALPPGVMRAPAKPGLAIESGQLVLGGFSQGAMLSLDVALHRDSPLAALVLMSGTLLAESEWGPRMKMLSGVPILMSHGRGDPLLPFSIAEILRDQLRASGARVEFIEFGGGHEIPPRVLEGVMRLLQSNSIST